MKKHLLVVIAIAMISGVGFSQGSLQFNQVKLVTAAESVPEGKVWKVESAHLSRADGLGKHPVFKINDDEIVLGYDAYLTTDLENVTDIIIQVSGSKCVNTSLSNVNITLNGLSGLTPIVSTLNGSGSFVPGGSYQTIATFNSIPNSGNNVIDSWRLSFTQVNTGSGSDKAYLANFRVIFVKANGSSMVYYVSTNQGNGSCSNYSAGTTFPSVSQSINPLVVSRPQISTQFPIWLPAGTALEAVTNIASLSVIEFNVMP